MRNEYSPINQSYGRIPSNLNVSHTTYAPPPQQQQRSMNVSRNNNSMPELFRCEDELKQKIQQTENLILENRKDKFTLEQLNALIQDEDRSSILRLKAAKQHHNSEPYTRKMQRSIRSYQNVQIQRFKRKVKEHKEYVDTFFGAGAFQSNNDMYNLKKAAQLESQNLQLQENKMNMYEYEQIHNTVGYSLDDQGRVLNRGFEHHRTMREQADEAESAITLIQRAILRRKVMFGSLIVLFLIAVIFVVIKKLSFFTSDD